MSDIPFLTLLLGIITSSLDGIFTLAVVNRGGHEANPIVRFLVGRIGAPSTVSLTRVGIISLLFAFWMLRDITVVVSILIVTSCAAIFTGKSVLVSRPRRGFDFSEIGEA